MPKNNGILKWSIDRTNWIWNMKGKCKPKCFSSHLINLQFGFWLVISLAISFSLIVHCIRFQNSMHTLIHEQNSLKGQTSMDDRLRAWKTQKWLKFFNAVWENFYLVPIRLRYKLLSEWQHDDKHVKMIPDWIFSAAQRKSYPSGRESLVINSNRTFGLNDVQ